MELEVFEAAAPHAALLLAHGAGAGRRSPFMVQSARGLAARGVTAATFDFPYITNGRRVPDPAPVLERCWREAIGAGRALAPGLPLFIGGKSMGGRMASHVAAAGGEGLAGLVFLGYPLHPPGDPARRRDAHLPSIAEPMLFVQGTRDGFGGAAEIRALLPRLRRATLHEVEGADHSFRVTGRGAPTSGEVLDAILDAVAAWIAQVRGLVYSGDERRIDPPA